MTTPKTKNFKDLFEGELEDLGFAGAEVQVASRYGSAAGGSAASRGSRSGNGDEAPTDDRSFPEPYATFVSEDLAGLCLSGGGIRSATFNLGLLDGLNELGLIEGFHYLSTVSGGGYIGSWWSAWLARRAPADSEPFPPRVAGGQEPPEIRHLREFSNFLSPRVGFLEIETWQFVSSVLIAALPTVIAASMVIVAGVLAYLLCCAAVIAGNGVGTAVITAATLGLLLFYELETTRREKIAGKKGSLTRYIVLLTAACAITGLAAHLLRHDLIELVSPIIVHDRTATPVATPSAGTAPAATAPPTAGRTARLEKALEKFNEVGRTVRGSSVTAPPMPSSYAFSDELRFLWLPVLAWMAAIVLLSVVRLLVQRFGVEATATVGRPLLDRTLARLVAFSVFWLAGLVVLNLSLFIDSAEMAAAVSASGLSLGMIASYLLRKFVLAAPSGSQSGTLQSILRVLTPQILAYLALVLIAAGIGNLVINQLAGGSSVPVLVMVTAVVLALSAFLYNPNEMGLHAFYRSRIARSYLGASNFLPPHNRQVTAQKGDDLALADLCKRPLHLVCTAANDLSGDGLATLNRGARSATLSRSGFAVGDRWWPWTAEWKVTLASAVTASGAAVNPNMGSYSKQLGGAVTFLLGALNVRLGLWLWTAKAGAWAKRFRGLMFYREIFAATKADDQSATFHLSDGGHFENLGLYELLRRRCRYILVSDCGADADHQFEDLGNALRRAREDFAVEVDIDLDPLQLDAKKIARQHVAVGDVFYPGGDRGVILYVKPVLAGGEPDDVLQYSLRNESFPHETTGDQFFDEAQWESYRRLGLHAVRTIFRFAQGSGMGLDDVFGQARLEWYPAPAGLLERSLACASRRYDIEKQLRGVDDEAFLSGTYPELAWPADMAASGAGTAASHAKLLPLITQMIQLLEDVYVSCNLKQHWNHPLNVEWMNTFGRWFTAPMVMTWWPILSPMFNRGAIGFAQERFALPSPRAAFAEVGINRDLGVASFLWKWMGNEIPAKGLRCSYLVDVGQAAPIELAVLFATVAGKTAKWKASEFFVPPTFWGAGIGRHFLKELLKVLQAHNIAAVEVDLERPVIKDESRRKELSDLMQMYRQEDLKVQPGSNCPPGVIRMARSL